MASVLSRPCPQNQRGAIEIVVDEMCGATRWSLAEATFQLKCDELNG